MRAKDSPKNHYCESNRTEEKEKWKMALSRTFLEGLNLTEAQINAITEGNSASLAGVIKERDQYKADAEKLEAVQKELDDTKAQLKSAKNDSFKVKYEALKEEYDIYKSDVETKALNATKDKAYRTMLKEAGISEKRIDAIMKVTDLASVEMDGDTLKHAEDLKKTVTEEWADFIVKTEPEGAGTPTPPAGEGGGTPAKPIPLIF